MEVFVARQPIFDHHKNIFAYELLYRNNMSNSFPNINGNQATTELIMNSLINIGFDSLSEGKPCFINFTENLLEMRLPSYLNPLKIVVEILNSVRPSQSLLTVCRELKKGGFQIALDNYTLLHQNPYSYELLQFVDYLKVDFLTTDDRTRKRYEELARSTNTILIAERIEKPEDYWEAQNRGYQYFQGYLFSKPFVFSACVTTLKIELSKFVFTRAKMCEEIVGLCGLHIDCGGAFLTGMLSVMNTLNNLPLDPLLDALPLSQAMQDALKGKQNKYRDILDLIQAIEEVKWKTISGLCQRLGITELQVFKIYAETQTWYINMLKIEEGISY